MAKVMTVAEAIESMKATKTNKKGELVVNRFNKRNFNALMVALANDVNFTTQIAKAKKGTDEVELEDIMVTKDFRKWCKKLVEKMGVDSSESERIMTDEFLIENMDGIYEFFCTALYMYMDCGNRFDLPCKEDFKGGFYLKVVPETTKISDAKNPGDGSLLGTFEVTKGKHKELKVKTGCPSYLQKRKKVK
jgi:hypothetical protein